MQSKHRSLEEEPNKMLQLVSMYSDPALNRVLTLMPSMEPMLMTEDVFSLDALAVKRGRQLQSNWYNEYNRASYALMKDLRLSQCKDTLQIQVDDLFKGIIRVCLDSFVPVGTGIVDQYIKIYQHSRQSYLQAPFEWWYLRSSFWESSATRRSISDFFCRSAGMAIHWPGPWAVNSLATYDNFFFVWVIRMHWH